MRWWILSLAFLPPLSGCSKQHDIPSLEQGPALGDARAVDGPVTTKGKDVGGPCALDGDCTSKICYANVCRRACQGASGCTPTEDCHSDDGKHPAFCVERTYPAGMGQSCAVTGTCPAGMACQLGQDSAAAFCTGECKDGVGCPPTMRCRMFKDSTAPGGKKGYCWRRELCSPCQTDEQCGPGNRCVRQGKDSFCTVPCHEGSTECPRTADCKDLGGGIFGCVHRSGSCVGDGSMCQPCNDEWDCKAGALCLSYAFSKELFCATSCPTMGASCENNTAYQCRAIALSATESVNHCMPHSSDPTKDISCVKPLTPTMQVGDVMPDFAMVGYLDENADGSLKGEPLRVIKLSDLSANSKLILFNVSSGTCGACAFETLGFAGLLATYRKDGLMIFQVLYDGQPEGEKPTRAFLGSWIGLLNAQGACGIDPDRNVVPYNTHGSTPLNMLVDAKTRKILFKWNSTSPPGFITIDAAVKKYLGL